QQLKRHVVGGGAGRVASGVEVHVAAGARLVEIQRRLEGAEDAVGDVWVPVLFHADDGVLGAAVPSRRQRVVAHLEHPAGVVHGAGGGEVPGDLQVGALHAGAV